MFLFLDDKRKELVKVALFIVPSQMSHHAEAEACDLVMEVEQLDQLIQEKILHFLTCAKGDNGIVITKLNFKSGRRGGVNCVKFFK